MGFKRRFTKYKPAFFIFRKQQIKYLCNKELNFIHILHKYENVANSFLLNNLSASVNTCNGNRPACRN